MLANLAALRVQRSARFMCSDSSSHSPVTTLPGGPRLSRYLAAGGQSRASPRLGVAAACRRYRRKDRMSPVLLNPRRYLTTPTLAPPTLALPSTPNPSSCINLSISPARFLSFLSGIQETKIFLGTLTNGTRHRTRKAAAGCEHSQGMICDAAYGSWCFLMLGATALTPSLPALVHETL